MAVEGALSQESAKVTRLNEEIGKVRRELGAAWERLDVYKEEADRLREDREAMANENRHLRKLSNVSDPVDVVRQKRFRLIGRSHFLFFQL